MATSKLCSSEPDCLSTRQATNQLEERFIDKGSSLSPSGTVDSHSNTLDSEATDDQAVGVLTEKEKEALLEHYYTLYPGFRPIEGQTTGTCDPAHYLCSSCQANWRPQSQRIPERRAKQEDRQPNPENKPAQGEEAS